MKKPNKNSRVRPGRSAKRTQGRVRRSPIRGDKARFDQLLDDAVFGVKNK